LWWVMLICCHFLSIPRVFSNNFQCKWFLSFSCWY
jgi:hypothetical protein